VAFCSKCGAEIPGNAGFCAKCGAPGAAAAPSAGQQTGMQENVAGFLCYVAGWLTGLIFFLIDKRPFVRFHAAQSMVVFAGLHLIGIVVGKIFGLSFLFGGGFGAFGSLGLGMLVYALVQFAGLVLWIVLMIKAFQHEMFRVPVAADVADTIAGK